MSLYEMFETDGKKEAEGVEIKIGKNADGSVPTFVIAAMYKTNPAYMKALERITKEYKAELQSETLTNAQAEEINLDVFVDTVLKGWSNVQDRTGKAVAHTKKAAKQLLTDLPRLYDRLTTEAQNLARFKAAIAEADAKN